ncbi:MAG: sigma-70 family RNA polymerase sigma factor [Microthrixaceae bacterium]
MSDSVGMYLNEIGAVPLLDAEDEIELAKAIEAGNDALRRKEAGERGRKLDRSIAAGAAAKDRFIRANLRLVVSVARRYPLPAGMELLDLVQEGNLGLEHAVDKFDWRKGFKFSTYATFWIRQAIGRALDQKASLVRLPGDRSASLRSALRHVSGDGDELDAEHARLHRLTTPTSLDRAVGDDDSSELVDLIADASPAESALLKRAREVAPAAVGTRPEGPQCGGEALAPTASVPTARSARLGVTAEAAAGSRSGPSTRCGTTHLSAAGQY